MAAYASLAFGCPFESTVEPAVVLDVVAQYAEHGADVIVLADTQGVGVPEQVEALVGAALELVPAERLAMHMHDSNRRARENIAVAAKLGASNVQRLPRCTIAGMERGGCPRVMWWRRRWRWKGCGSGGSRPHRT